MKEVRSSNGVTLSYDETLEPGDLIIGYNKGYFEFIKFEERKDSTPLAYSKQKYKENGAAVKGKTIYCCDAYYCRKAATFIFKRIEEIEKEKERLQQIYDEIDYQ